MSSKQEIQAIDELAIDITDMDAGWTVHCTTAGSGAVNVTVFNAQNDIEWQQNVYEWGCDEAFLPKLRFVRHQLERMYQETLIGRSEVAA